MVFTILIVNACKKKYAYMAVTTLSGVEFSLTTGGGGHVCVEHEKKIDALEESCKKGTVICRSQCPKTSPIDKSEAIVKCNSKEEDGQKKTWIAYSGGPLVVVNAGYLPIRDYYKFKCQEEGGAVVPVNQ